MPKKKVEVNIYHHKSGSPRSRGTVKKCGLCNGTGKDTTVSLLPVKCSACDGKGWVRV